MSKVNEFSEIVERFWWIVPIVAIIVLFNIPAKVGLPHPDYEGCEREASICQVSEIKAIDMRSEDTTIITVPMPDTADLGDGEDIEVDFKLTRPSNNISIGNVIVMDFNRDRNEASLFIEKDTRLLWKLVKIGVWYGPTAVIDLDTYEEVERG